MLQRADHVLLHVITTMHVTRAVNHIPMVRNTIFRILATVVKIFAVYSKTVFSVHCNRIVW